MPTTKCISVYHTSIIKGVICIIVTIGTSVGSVVIIRIALSMEVNRETLKPNQPNKNLIKLKTC